jgi:hypothetical protein
MDIVDQVKKTVESVTKDGKLLEKFKADPVATVKELLGGAVPDEVVDKVVSGVKAKLTADKVSDVAGALGGLFGKKD